MTRQLLFFCTIFDVSRPRDFPSPSTLVVFTGSCWVGYLPAHVRGLRKATALSHRSMFIFLRLPHGRLAAESPWAPDIRNSISHPKNVFQKAFGRTTRPRFCAFSPKMKCTREITSLTGSSSHEELNRPGTFSRRNCDPYRGMTFLWIENRVPLYEAFCMLTNSVS